MKRSDILREAATAVMQSIELCGSDPMQSAKDIAADYGVKLTISELNQVRRMAQGQWDNARRDAGVKSRYIGRDAMDYLNDGPFGN